MLQGEKLQKAYHDYIVNYSVEANLAPTTVQNKKDTLKRLITFLDGRPFTLKTCREFLSYLYSNGWNSPNSRLDLVRVLRAFVNFLYNYKYIKENFSKELIKPKVPNKEFEYVEPKKVEEIIIAGTEYSVHDNERNRKIKDEMRAALRFILRTGLRINELISLKGSDLNLDDNPATFWVISKGGNRDVLPLPKDMLDELKIRSNNDRLFEVTATTCNLVLQRGAKKLGIKIKITNHTLRHIFATYLDKNKVTPQFTQRLMRHSSIEITNRYYTHLDLQDLSLAVNSAQGVVVNGLTPVQMFDNVEIAVSQTGIKNDNRFNCMIERTQDAKEMVIRISCG